MEHKQDELHVPKNVTTMEIVVKNALEQPKGLAKMSPTVLQKNLNAKIGTFLLNFAVMVLFIASPMNGMN